MKFRWSMLVILSIGVPASVSAAEDDVVIDGTAQQPVPAKSGIVRLPQREQPLNAIALRKEEELTSFLQMINRECSLTEVQMKKATLAGKRDIQRLIRGSQRVGASKPSPLFGSSFITTESLVYKILMTKLTPVQKFQFDVLREKSLRKPVPN